MNLIRKKLLFFYPYGKKHGLSVQKDNEQNSFFCESPVFYHYAFFTYYLILKPLFQRPLSAPLHQSGCPCETHHNLNLLITIVFSVMTVESIRRTKLNDASCCFSLFLCPSPFFFLSLPPLLLSLNSWYPRQQPFNLNTAVK